MVRFVAGKIFLVVVIKGLVVVDWIILRGKYGGERRWS